MAREPFKHTTPDEEEILATVEGPHDADHGYTDFRDNPFWNREAFDSTEAWLQAVDRYQNIRECKDDSELIAAEQDAYLESLNPQEREALAPQANSDDDLPF